jgi:hypothetical protein
MINYSLKYGVAETARMFDVDRQTIKTWAYIFAEYLSSGANAGKGLVRQFTIEDVRVFAYVLMYWEESPDIDYIKIGLTSRSQYDYDNIDEFITGLLPLFRDMPEDIDETWRGIVFGGEFELGDLFSMADSFRLAGDRLVNIAWGNHEERELFQPAIYNYRHATELYIKAVIGEEINHDLYGLFEKLKANLKAEFDTIPPEWFENIITAFHESDPKGTTFRYGDLLSKNELFVDIIHVKKLMSWLGESFRRIRLKRHKQMYSS